MTGHNVMLLLLYILGSNLHVITTSVDISQSVKVSYVHV